MLQENVSLLMLCDLCDLDLQYMGILYKACKEYSNERAGFFIQ
jgi:hypothetical protein